jgi:hypothetical protein
MAQPSEGAVVDNIVEHMLDQHDWTPPRLWLRSWRRRLRAGKPLTAWASRAEAEHTKDHQRPGAWGHEHKDKT